MKVLVDGRMVGRQLHGIARYTINLVQGLNELGCDVSILANNDEAAEVIGTYAVREAILTKTSFAKPLDPVGLQLELRKVLKSKSFDVVHFPSFAAPWRPSKKTVVTIHDLIHLRPPASPTYNLYYRAFVKPALKSCGAVITVSDWSKNDVQTKLNIKPSKIHVVRNGLEPQWFTPQAQPELHTGEGLMQKPFFLCLSNPKPHKNVITLLEASQKLWNEGHDFNLVLSLGGEELPLPWKSYEKNIILIKSISDEELRPYFLHAQALISPSLYEGYDLPAAEGLALGKTVIVSSGSAHDELQGERLFMYGKPTDIEGLARTMRECLPSKTKIMAVTNANAPHNVSTRLEMARQTLKVYQTL